MEGVGARLGRSSTRYGPSTVFTGSVRKWKKKWVNVPPPNSNRHHHHHHTAANTTINGSDGSSHLLLYKWTPISPAQTTGNGNDGGNNDNYSDKDGDVAQEQPKKKFKYIPIIVLVEPKNESPEQMEDEAKPIEGSTLEEISVSDESHEKPDINDVPMDENQAKQDSHVELQDLNESTLDLSLDLNADDGKMNQTQKQDQIKDN